MTIEFSNQDIRTIYEHVMVELVKLDILANMKPNPVHPDSYREEMAPMLSVTEKIENAYPQLLDGTLQKFIRDKAEKKLRQSN
jgi:hypothetical protein